MTITDRANVWLQYCIVSLL